MARARARCGLSRLRIPRTRSDPGGAAIESAVWRDHRSDAEGRGAATRPRAGPRPARARWPAGTREVDSGYSSMVVAALLSAIHMLTLALGAGAIFARGRALAGPLDDAGWKR